MKKFNRSRALRKLNHKQNNRIIKQFSIVVSFTILVGAIIFFSFAKFENNQSYSLINGNIGVFDDYFSYYLKDLPESNTISYDATDESNMRFIGKNPDNYILFGCDDEDNPTIDTCELWRIIGVFDEVTTGIQGEFVKIVKDEVIKIGNEYVTETSNNWSEPLALNQTLNHKDSKYASSKLVLDATWSTGAVSYQKIQDGYIVRDVYDDERSGTKSKSPNYKYDWKGKVAIPYMSDYLYSTSGISINDQSSPDECRKYMLYTDFDNTYWGNSGYLEITGKCLESGWLLTPVIGQIPIITLTADADSTSNFLSFFNENANSTITYDPMSPNKYYQPSVYLKERTYCQNCNEENVGTKTNPYKVTAKVKTN